MDRTFDALEQKLTPGQIVGEVWHLAKGGSVAGAGKLWQIARDYPMPATVIASGIGLLLWESSRSSRDYEDYDDDRMQDRGYYYDAGGAGSTGGSRSYNADWQADEEGRLSAAAGAVKDAASEARETVAEAASHAKEKVSDVAGTVRDRAADLGHRTREKASGLTERARSRASETGDRARYQAQRARLGFWQMMEENPLGVGIAALAIGALAGLTIPSTRREDELMGETRDRLLDDAKELGREALDKGKQVASTAVETLKDEARSQGLTPEGVVEKVRAVGRETKEAVKEEARRQDLPGIVKPETSGQEIPVGEPELVRR